MRRIRIGQPIYFACVLSLLLAMCVLPASIFAGTPNPYHSAVEVVKASAEAVTIITPDSEGAEYLVTLVSTDGAPLSGSVYAATSRSMQVDAFFYQDAGGSWVATGADGRIVLSNVAADSAAGTPGVLGNVLTFSLKVVSTAPGKPYFALGLHADCARACAQGTELPWDCDSSHIIGESAFGGFPPGYDQGGSANDSSPSANSATATAVNEAQNETKNEASTAPASVSVEFVWTGSELWYADGKTAYSLPVRVTPMDEGTGVPGIEVVFSIAPAGEGASLSAAKVTTGDDGIAEVYITASEPGAYVVAVSISDMHADRKDLAVGFIRVRPIIKFFLDGKQYTVDGAFRDIIAPPIVLDDRVYLSARDMGNALDAMIMWDQDSQAVSLWMDNAVFRIPVGAKVIYGNIGGSSFESPIEAPAINVDGRVYLPFRAVFEQLGYQVSFDQGRQMITAM